ncbi:hypothetical protein [Enterovirga aerilata]|uniref:Uncharacterized protein n=1 Tax=Enterovirga aerilata TaxID=2730920 RepID=A0A849I7J2_9HYPH|nr:hypothetical protein [Enterovirga sp. DB1703]NNM72369.1 hypothetical protein [Enterovirga sp. DB1703]
MNAELYGSSPSEAESSGPVSPEEVSGEGPQAEMESSVLDALRPLLRPKRRKEGGENAVSPAGAVAAASESEPAEREVDYLEEVKAITGTEEDPEPADTVWDTFMAVGEDLERRSRQSATMARLLEQHRYQLQTAERERDAAYEKFARIVPVVQETAQALREALDARKLDEDPAKMHRLFMLNGRALDELEKVAVTLFADFLWVKSAWEQYARSAEDARKLRASLDAAN